MDWNIDNYRRIVERHLTPAQIADLREVLLKTTAQHRDDDPLLLIVAIILLNCTAVTGAIDRFTAEAKRAEQTRRLVLRVMLYTATVSVTLTVGIACTLSAILDP